MTIRSHLWFVLVLIGLSLPAVAADSKDDRPLVVLLGDSIRMNYQQSVREALAGKAEVWSPKENCRHTFFTLENLEGWLKSRSPDLIHINVELRDIFLNAKTDKPRHTLTAYEKNLRAMFNKLDGPTEAKVIFAIATAVDEKLQAASKSYRRVVRRNKHVRSYNAVARRVAKESKVTVNDLNAFMVNAGPEKIFRPTDGIQLSPSGCKLIGNKVARVIASKLSIQP
ncbi:MAG: hypothetical protein CMO80_05790 [Verrucomicrobiales bacterium]|nr:hypothetical protein [Verrucomicrobiales bacterium]|tara:strand:+ start:526 stop:1203 length:678 start_codon:yes stop_codon:yes gene_type:complete